MEIFNKHFIEQLKSINSRIEWTIKNKRLTVVEQKGVIMEIINNEKNAIEILENLIEEQQKELENKDKIINEMAEELTSCIHSKEWVIEYFEKKVKDE